jgi:hypothetical protein
MTAAQVPGPTGSHSATPDRLVGGFSKPHRSDVTCAGGWPRSQVTIGRVFFWRHAHATERLGTEAVASLLYVSFWDLCLANLPQGRFEHRVISAGEASVMIRGARADKNLVCVSNDDLLAPFGTKQRRRHDELCAVLRGSYGCPMRFEDFLVTSDHEGTAVHSVTPLQAAELQTGDRLLIVACDYQLAERMQDSVELEDLFVMAPDSVSFHLISRA